MCLQIYRYALYIFTGAWDELGTPHSHCDVTFIPLLAINDMPQPDCVSRTSMRATPFFSLTLSKTYLRRVYVDVCVCTVHMGRAHPYLVVKHSK